MPLGSENSFAGLLYRPEVAPDTDICRGFRTLSPATFSCDIDLRFDALIAPAVSCISDAGARAAVFGCCLYGTPRPPGAFWPGRPGSSPEAPDGGGHRIPEDDFLRLKA